MLWLNVFCIENLSDISMCLKVSVSAANLPLTARGVILPCKLTHISYAVSFHPCLWKLLILLQQSRLLLSGLWLSDSPGASLSQSGVGCAFHCISSLLSGTKMPCLASWCHLWRKCQGRRKGGLFLYLLFWQVLQISHIALFIQVRYRIFNLKYFT